MEGIEQMDQSEYQDDRRARGNQPGRDGGQARDPAMRA
jgi:hypothetical protein